MRLQVRYMHLQILPHDAADGGSGFDLHGIRPSFAGRTIPQIFRNSYSFCKDESRAFPKIMLFSILGNRAAEPFRSINDSYSLVLILRLPCSGDQQLGIRVFDAQKRSDLPFKGFLEPDFK